MILWILLGCWVQAEEPLPIRVGMVLPLTGSMATFGQSAQQGVDIFLAHHGGRVLGHPIEVIVADDEGQPEKSVEVARDLLQQGVVAIVGEVFSTNSRAIATVTEPAKVPLLMPTATNASITGDFVFRICVTDSMQAVAMANFAMQSLKIKRVGIFVDTHSNYSVGLADAFQQQFVGTIRVADYTSGDVDYQSAIQYLKKNRTQAIYVPGYYPDVAVIMQQARTLRFSGLFLGSDGWDSEEFPGMAGPAAEGSLFMTHFAKDDPGNTLELSDGIGALFYDAMAVLSNALERSLALEGPVDHYALQKALLETHDVPITTGKFSFDAHHNAVRPLVILAVHPQGFFWQARWPE